MTTWDEALHELERSLAAARDAENDQVPGSFAVPVGLGPLPAELEPRARLLLSAFHQAEVALQRDLNLVARELALLQRVRSPESSGASYVDQAV